MNSYSKEFLSVHILWNVNTLILSNRSRSERARSHGEIYGGTCLGVVSVILVHLGNKKKKRSVHAVAALSQMYDTIKQTILSPRTDFDDVNHVNNDKIWVERGTNWGPSVSPPPTEKSTNLCYCWSYETCMLLHKLLAKSYEKQRF